MSFATLNGQPVICAHVTLPQWGVWTAELEIDSDQVPSGRVALEFDGGVRFDGTVLGAGEWQGRATAFVVGGAGKMRTVLSHRPYSSVPARLPVGDIVREAGETLADGVNLEAFTLDTWHRTQGEAADALTNLVLAMGLTWRVLRDGTVWVGQELWPLAKDLPLVMHEDLQKGRAELAPDAPTLDPGVNLDGRRVTLVTHVLSPDGLRTTAFYGRHRQRADFEGAVRRMLPELLYLREYDATVVAQGADGLLEVVCDDERIGGLPPLPIRLGLPGCSVKVSQGARVRVGFAGADPRRPYAALWDTDAAALELNLAADTHIRFQSGVLPVARATDTAGPYPIVGGNPKVKA